MFASEKEEEEEEPVPFAHARPGNGHEDEDEHEDDLHVEYSVDDVAMILHSSGTSVWRPISLTVKSLTHT